MAEKRGRKTADRAAPFSPVEALRVIREILADTSMGNAERIAAAAVVCCADNGTGAAWASYRSIHREFGLSLDSIAGALRSHGGKAIGKYLAVIGRGKQGSVQYAALRQSERYGQQSALCSSGSSAPVVAVQRSAQQRQTIPSNLPHKLTPNNTCENDDPTGHVIDEVRVGLFDDQGARPRSGGGKASHPERTREPDPIWDALSELFNKDNPTKAERSRLGRVAADLRAKNAAPEEVRSVYQRCKTEWDGKAFSPEALAKWFDQFRGGPASTGSPARIRDGSGRYGRVATRIVGIVAPEQPKKDHSAGH